MTTHIHIHVGTKDKRTKDESYIIYTKSNKRIVRRFDNYAEAEKQLERNNKITPGAYALAKESDAFRLDLK